MAHRHRQRPVRARLGRQPVIGELRVLRVVRRHDHDLLAAVASLDHEVRVRGARRRQVRPPDQQVAGVEPVAGLRHVGLVAERLRRGGRQVGIPVVERQDHPADQRQEPGAGGVGGHRHRRDRREADAPIRPVALDRVHVRGGDQLHDLVPGGAHEPALAPLAAVQPHLLRVLDDLRPGVDRIAQPRSRLAKHRQQAAAHVRVLQPQRRVLIPGERRSPGAAARLVLRHLRARRGIVDRLGLPGDQPVLDVHVPRARSRAVHAVGRAHHLVVRPAPAVGALPLAVLGHQLAPALLVDRPATQEAMRLEQRTPGAGAGARRVTRRSSLAGAHGPTFS